MFLNLRLQRHIQASQSPDCFVFSRNPFVKELTTLSANIMYVAEIFGNTP
jgi:hypothetical protein